MAGAPPVGLLGLAAGALFLLAIVAFRRARGVLSPTARRAATRHRLGRLGLYLLAVGAALVAALPFIWGTITAFKEDADLYNSENNPFVFNLDPTGEHVSFLFSDTVAGYVERRPDPRDRRARLVARRERREEGAVPGRPLDVALVPEREGEQAPELPRAVLAPGGMFVMVS